MRWRIYYTDGSTYSDRDGSPFDAPTDGVQIIAQEDPGPARGFQVDFKNLHGKDFFVWDESWACVDIVGLIQYIRRRVGTQKILLGEMCFRNDEFQKHLDRASEEGLG